MDSVLSHHIMLCARIWEIVYLYIVLDAFAYEAQTMLPYDHRVNSTLADKQLALEILGLVDEACLCISFRITFRMIHIAFSIHHLVPFPVDYRTACYSYLEDVRIICDQRYGHESAVAPSMYSDTLLVDIWKLHQHLHSFDLVCHFRLTALTVDRLLEVQTSVLRAPVILDIDEIAALCHVHLPPAELSHVCVLDHLGEGPP